MVVQGSSRRSTGHVVIRLCMVLALLLVPAVAFSAVDMFIKIEGIDGESQDDNHKNEIDVIAFSEGLSDSDGFMQIKITKPVDKSSPLLRRMVASKKQVTKARLTVRSSDHVGTRVPVFVIDLDNVGITSVNGSGSWSEDQMTEEVTLNFERIVWTYTPSSDDGGGGTVSAQWDLTINRNRQ